MGLADLHIHTFYSWDGTMTPAAVLKSAAMAGLNVIAVTDHDDIRGSRQALDLAGKYGMEVIPGSEISTSEGHLLALFVDEHIPAGLSLLETLTFIGKKGGLAIAPHPAAIGTPSLSYPSIKAVLAYSGARRVLCGIEVYNGGLPYRRSNMLARSFADTLLHPLACVGNSDAHYFWGIGRGVTYFPGRTAADLRQALINRTTNAHGAKGVIALSPVAGWIWHYALKKLGWVTSNVQPHMPLRLARRPVISS